MIQYEPSQMLRKVAAQLEAIAAGEITSFEVRQLEAAAEILANVASRCRGGASGHLEEGVRERLAAALRDGGATEELQRRVQRGLGLLGEDSGEQHDVLSEALVDAWRWARQAGADRATGLAKDLMLQQLDHEIAALRR